MQATFTQCMRAKAWRFNSRTSGSFPPTIASVGASTRSSAAPAKIGPASARHHRVDQPRKLGGRHQRRAGARTRPEIADLQTGHLRLLAQPLRDSNQAIRQKRNVETKLGGLQIHFLLIGGQQIDEQRRQARLR